MTSNTLITVINDLEYHQFDITSQDEFNQISSLISQHLSEPYSIYVYWYFLNTWPQYCIIVREKPQESQDKRNIIGVIISKVEPHRNVRMRGYIGMVVIEPKFRKLGIGKSLVKLSIQKMIEIDNVDEIMLETEVINEKAINLYQNLGFLKVKRLYRYYLNTHDAFRLILPINDNAVSRIAFLPPIETIDANKVEAN